MYFFFFFFFFFFLLILEYIQKIFDIYQENIDIDIWNVTMVISAIVGGRGL